MAHNPGRRRRRAVWLGITVATLLAVSIPVALGATGAAPVATDPPSPAGPGFAPRSDPAQAALGVTYPVDLYTHCGIGTARFAGRDWVAVRPAPDPQRLPNSAGITQYTGYVAGTMVLVRPDLLRFILTDPHAAGAGEAFDFVPAPGPGPPCA